MYVVSYEFLIKMTSIKPYEQLKEDGSLVTWAGSMIRNHIDVSQNSGTPKSSILKGFSIINHPFWGTTIFGNIHMGPSREPWKKNSIWSTSCNHQTWGADFVRFPQWYICGRSPSLKDASKF